MIKYKVGRIKSFITRHPVFIILSLRDLYTLFKYSLNNEITEA